MRRALKPIRDELDGEVRQVELGSEAWLHWWRSSGERELRAILMTAWDPIGVRDAPEAWGEYDDYASGVVRRLRDGADHDAGASAVVAYLGYIERDFMSLTPHDQDNEDLAEALVAWYEWSVGRR